ncbi:MAG: tandem-95 repeat protein, partial [Planctomycetaceae bacterium]|nr:tandem-95 repeat protein [Planctomycetaceae bacterium]
MADFSWTRWITELSQFGRQPIRRPRRRKLPSVEGLEDRTLLTPNLPVANDDSYQVAGDTTLNGSTVLVNDTDADGDTINQAVFASDVSHGNLTLASNGTFVYIPTTGFSGTDSFTYYARDNVHGENSASPARVTITVGTTNVAPVATPLVINVATDTVFSGGLSGTDKEGDSLTFAAGSTSAVHGTVSINTDGSFTYTPGPGYTGPDSFSFNVDDGTSTSADALVRVNVGSGSNHAPVPTSISINAVQDTQFAGGLSAVDQDGDALTFNQGSTLASHGTVSISLNGNFSYTPAVGYVGADSFSFTASDGVFSSTTDGIVSIQVASSGNATPVATAISINVGFNTTFAGSLSGTDADGDSLTFAAGSKAAAHGTVTINSTNGSFTYAPTNGYSGSDSFSFHVNDGTVNSSDAVVSVQVAAGPNHAPVATATSINVTFNTKLSGTLSGTDADGNTLTFLAGNTAAAHGTVVINANGTFNYTPTTGYSGSDTFSFKVNDGTVNSANATVSVTVAPPVNHAPVATPQSINVAFNTQYAGTLAGTDSDGNSLTFLAGTTAAAHGTVVINANGNFTYKPTTGYSGSDSFSFKVNDGTVSSANATVSVTVATAVNHAPVATPQSINVVFNTQFAGTLTGTDSDGNTLTFAAGSTAASHGTVVINANGNFTYKPTTGYSGSDSFSFKVNDGTVNSVDATVSVTVAAHVNSAPVATPITINAILNKTFSGQLAGTDADGDSLTFSTGSTLAVHGVVSITTSGAFTYTPNTGYTGNDAFSFKVNDGTVNSADATVTVHVDATNTAPVATPTSIKATLNTTYSGQLAGTDANGDTLTFSLGSTLAAHGVVSITTSGAFTYTPNTGYTGSDAFSFKVNDGLVNSADATVSVQVAPPNRAPNATPANISVTFNTQYSGTLSGTDADGDTLTFAAGSTAAAHGTVLINSDGTFTYTPNTGYSGNDSFSFIVNDGTVNSANATVSVQVAARVNHVPVANAANISVAFNTTYLGTLTGTDADGDALTFTAGSTAAEHGTVLINTDGSFSYVPNTGYSGTDSFSFKVNDGTINSADATVGVLVAAANRPPVATPASINVSGNSTFTGTLHGTDADGNALTFI